MDNPAGHISAGVRLVLGGRPLILGLRLGLSLGGGANAETREQPLQRVLARRGDEELQVGPLGEPLRDLGVGVVVGALLDHGPQLRQVALWVQVAQGGSEHGAQAGTGRVVRLGQGRALGEEALGHGRGPAPCSLLGSGLLDDAHGEAVDQTGGLGRRQQAQRGVDVVEAEAAERPLGIADQSREARGQAAGRLPQQSRVLAAEVGLQAGAEVAVHLQEGGVERLVALDVDPLGRGQVALGVGEGLLAEVEGG